MRTPELQSQADTGSQQGHVLWGSSGKGFCSATGPADGWFGRGCALKSSLEQWKNMNLERPLLRAHHVRSLRSDISQC